MPPWSSRLLSSSSTSNINQLSTAPANVDGTVHQPRPVLSGLEPPTLRPQVASTPPVTRRHGRSISHPFPSIFGGGSKKDKKHSDKSGDFESTDDEVGSRSGKDYSGSPKKIAPGASPAVPEKDLVLGRCMTCDSQVRWPRGLKTFRCTVCLAINDLEPFNDPPPPLSSAKRGAESYPGLGVTKKALPLSVERTRVIIERCVNTYLRSRLEESDARPIPPTRSPPPSPLFAEPSEISEGLLHVQSHEQDHPAGPPPPEPLSTPPHPIPNPRSSSLLKTMNERVGRGNSESVTSAPPLDFPRRPIEQLGRRGSSPMLEVPEREDTTGLLNRRQDSDAGRKSILISSFSLFRSLENYVISSFNGSDCVNQSFLVARPTHPPRAASEGVQPKPILRNGHAPSSTVDTDVFEIDAKTLLAGDVAENGFWITGGRIERNSSNNGSKGDVSSDGRSGRDLVNMKTPRINWQELVEWYHLILHAGDDWVENWLELRPPDGGGEESARLAAKWDSISTQDLEQEISEGRMHAQRTLLKATENLLKRPKRPLKHPEEARFLLILLANPLLYGPGAPRHRPSASLQAPRSRSREPPQPSQQNGEVTPSRRQVSTSGSRNMNTRTSGPGHHSGIVKRILGLLSNLPNECHHYLISWFSRFSDPHFQRTVDLIGSFVTYRLSRQHNRKRSEAHFTAADLISSSVPGAGSNAQLHHALGTSVSSKSTKSDHRIVLYGEDWQIKAAARVMSLFFSANNNNPGRKRDAISPDLRFSSAGLNARHQAHVHGQILPISTFYNTLLDYSDLVADFEAWETHRGKLSFCQYPFFLSIWAKIHILEHDARRQMEVRAREAFFDSILSRKAVSQYLVLKVRRECLVDDSLRGVSEVVGAGQEEIKKGLRIEFVGEEGVDAGGLRKEWFLLLVREVFDPDHGLFVYDDDSRFCYFNPYCFESSEQFFLVGVLLGLAIYNSTILDIALPPFAFKKLLASAPSTSGPSTSTPRIHPGYTLEDLAEFRPALARGLRSLLEFEGNVQETFCRDFVAEVDRYGEIIEVPLCHNGKDREVTNANRHEFVDLYTQYLLDTAVARQYEPFKRGFFTVCGGNALSLFRPEEIELLIRGSDEPLDIASLRAVATYEQWGPNPDTEKQVVWFWDFFGGSSPTDQRKLLSFVTGSDRIPAMGATNLIIKIVCIGEDCERFPSARTCFNMLALYRYQSRERLEIMLWRAVADSEGFGLK